MRVDETGVLIVGGGLAGLATAAFLAHWGASPVLVERHETTSRHPRARGVNARTMELFDVLGISGRVRGTPSGRALAGNRGIRAMESLAGQDIGELHAPYFVDTDVDISDLSPARWCLCDQDELEPVLRDRAVELGADVRFATELVDVTVDDSGVLAEVLDRATGERRLIRARYLVAADGPQSPLRQRWGVGTEGEGTLATYLNIHFRADLAAPLGDRRFILSYVVNPDLMGALVPVDNADNWLLHVMYDPASGQSPRDFPEQRCVALVRSAAGIADLDVKIQSVLPWEAAGRWATRLRRGPVFFVGDAAHVMPPTGALGSNTGIQDAVNLAWKLAGVLRGVAGAELLDSYESERLPVARATVQQAVLRSRDRPVLLGEEFEGSAEILPDRVVHFGQRYRSTAVVGGDTAAVPADADPVWVDHCDGTPGTRAPHAPVRLDGRPASVLSLFGAGWTVVLGAEAAVDDTVAAVAADLDLPVTVHRIGADVLLDDPVGSQPYADAQLVLLVRPDGHVAWRAAADALPDPGQALRDALTGVLSRGGSR
ncbi:FAD-dependent monooxygenase [Micromonospora rosaria]|nr:FAD-dependent monooxygenase [Micromonospora rosaria]